MEVLRHPHRDPALVVWAGTRAGRAAVWALAVALLAFRDLAGAATIGAVLAFVLAFPARRNLALATGALATLWLFVLEQQSRHLAASGEVAPLVAPGAAVLVLALLYGCYRAAAAFDGLPGPLRRWPQAWLHGILWVALGAAWLLPGRSGEPASALFRLAVACLPFLVWRCGYLLLSGRRGSASGTAFGDHLMYLSPVYGGSPVPYGKGYDHLMDSDAATRARSQIAGLKLLALAWVWVGALWVLDAVVFGGGSASLGLTRLGELVAAGGGANAPIGHRWLSLVGELVRGTITLAIFGHFVIGPLRLFGFNVYRNTYKPLLSETVIDFWNRFYYYFKELLAEFFFFPTYVACFRNHPRLRIVAATLAAACLGNLYYHVLVYLPALAAAGVTGAWGLMSSRVLYTVLLAAGISVSLIRQQRIRGTRPAVPGPGLRVRRIAGVWLFYGIIQIWNVDPITLTFTERTRFFLSLFGAA
jgi:hypothetical protein